MSECCLRAAEKDTGAVHSMLGWQLPAFHQERREACVTPGRAELLVCVLQPIAPEGWSPVVWNQEIRKLSAPRRSSVQGILGLSMNPVLHPPLHTALSLLLALSEERVSWRASAPG